MKKRIILLFVTLSLVLFGFTACDEMVIDALAEDMSLAAGSFSVPQTPEAYAIYIAEEFEEEPEAEHYIPFFYIPVPPMPEPPTEPPTEPSPPPPRYKIALTFDDGPSQFTDYILDILEQYDARATFFVLGNRVHSGADIIRRTVELGNEVAGHSWNHRNFAGLSADAIRAQMKDTSAAIEYVLGEPPPPFFRPPYGIVTSRVRRVAEELEYSIINWSIDPKDWQNRDADTIYRLVMENAVDGGIVLLHDIRIYTKEAVERIVPGLIEKGFQLVTVSELLEYLYYDLEPGSVYNGRRR